MKTLLLTWILTFQNPHFVFLKEEELRIIFVKPQNTKFKPRFMNSKKNSTQVLFKKRINRKILER
jgi:hypothetical protein